MIGKLIFFEKKELTMKKIFKIKLTKFETSLWLLSVFILLISFIIAKATTPLIITTLIGVTALIFLAKGEPLGQIMTIFFSILYALISLNLKYYSEVITYLFMTLPSALVALIIWLKNPYVEHESVVRVEKLTKNKIIITAITTTLVTIIFHFILKALDTPHLLVSSISITTSFLASIMMFFRSRHYAMFYALNDIVLITLWTLATIENIIYFPMIICFFIFFINDSYAFVNWKRLNKFQTENK